MSFWERRKRNSCSVGTLRSAEWQLHTDVSGRHIGSSLRVIDPIFIGQVWPIKMRPTVFPKRRHGIIITRCLKSQKSADVIHIAAEIWKHAAQMEVNIYCTSVGTLIVATIYLQLIQNRYMFRSFTVLQCSHQHCVQPVASDVDVVGYL